VVQDGRARSLWCLFGRAFVPFVPKKGVLAFCPPVVEIRSVSFPFVGADCVFPSSEVFSFFGIAFPAFCPAWAGFFFDGAGLGRNVSAGESSSFLLPRVFCLIFFFFSTLDVLGSQTPPKFFPSYFAPCHPSVENWPYFPPAFLIPSSPYHARTAISLSKF